jgi:hypothetical protein
MLPDKASRREWWIHSRLIDWAPAMIGVAGYGCARAGVVIWVLSHGGLPNTALGWSGAASGLAAAGQAIALTVLLPYPRPRLRAAAWAGAAVAVGTAVIDAGLWVALGSAAEPAGYAWQTVLAVLLTIATMMRCRTGLRWASNRVGGYDLALVQRVLLRIAAVAIAASASAGIAVLLVDRPAAAHRLLGLAAVLGLATALSATLGWLPIVGEQRRLHREAVLAQYYDRIENPSPPTEPSDGDGA